MHAFTIVCLLALVAASYALTAPQRNAVLASHNSFRQLLANGTAANKDGKLMPKGKNVYKLKYSVPLENLAQKWVNRCVFEHSPASYRKHAGGTYGENLYYTTAQVDAASVLKQASALWWAELKKYGFNTKDTTLTQAQFNKGIGHFTQQAWGANTAIGCGVKWCPAKKFTLVSCNYQTGNIFNQKVYQTGEPCKKNTDCTTHKNSKCEVKTGLCSV
ncbi:venom allergen-like protein vap-2 [Aphelenchoides avenae]|nr:venom allergen-like protein vap-2 [Aphelenchus avenae]